MVYDFCALRDWHQPVPWIHPWPCCHHPPAMQLANACHTSLAPRYTAETALRPMLMDVISLPLFAIIFVGHIDYVIRQLAGILLGLILALR